MISGLDIGVRYVDLHTRNPFYDGYAWPSRREIGLEWSLKGTWQEKAVLAEEIGHILYPPFANHRCFHDTRFWKMTQWGKDSLSVAVARDERAALQWATSALIPDRAFWQFAASGPQDWWEWLEEFEVPGWFLEVKFGLVRAKMHEDGLRPFRWRELVRRV